jgi:F-type H+-transporting ATPase subunit gamma
VAATRDIQRRIRSVSNIGKVTRAMEAVSASKMRRAQAATLASRSYAMRAAEVIAYLRAESTRGVLLHPLLQDHPLGRPAALIVTPDRGLTGGLGLQIIRFAYRSVARELGSDVAWIAVGRKGRDFLVRTGADLVAGFTRIPDKPSVLDISPIAHLLLEGFLGPDYSSVHMVYTGFVSVMRQQPLLECLLPITPPRGQEVVSGEFSFEPSPEAILNEVVPRLLEMRIYQAVLEAQASEHSARMVAMRNATDAASDLESTLTLSYNKARQSDITSELLDIAGGAEALRRASARA